MPIKGEGLKRSRLAGEGLWSDSFAVSWSEGCDLNSPTLAGAILVDTPIKLLQGTPVESRTIPAKPIIRQSCGATG